MYLKDEHIITRNVSFTRTHRNEEGKPVGILPQAFEMRADRGEKDLSVNWLEYFDGDFDQNLQDAINDYRQHIKIVSGGKVGKKSVYAIANVGVLVDVCKANTFKTVKVDHNAKKSARTNKSHSSIIKIPFNDNSLMNLLATQIFNQIVFNADIPE